MHEIIDLCRKLSMFTKHQITDPRIFWYLLGLETEHFKRGNLDGSTGIIATLEFLEHEEPHCIAASCKAFLYMLDQATNEDTRLNIKKALNANQQAAVAQKIKLRLNAYHLYSTAGVRTIQHAVRPGEYRQSNSSFGFAHSNELHRDTVNNDAQDHQTFKYLLNRANIRGPVINGKIIYLEKFYYVLKEAYDLTRHWSPFASVTTFLRCTAPPERIGDIVYLLSLRFVQDIQSATSDAAIIVNISEYIQDLMALHPYADANKRSIMSFLLREIIFDLGLDQVLFKCTQIFNNFEAQIVAAQKRLKDLCANKLLDAPTIPEYHRALLKFALQSGDARLIATALMTKQVSSAVVQNLALAAQKYMEENQNRELETFIYYVIKRAQGPYEGNFIGTDFYRPIYNEVGSIFNDAVTADITADTGCDNSQVLKPRPT